MSLNANYTFTGNANWSIDGSAGSQTGGGTLEIDIPAGSTIEAAFLYATAYSTGQNPGVDLNFDGNTQTLTAVDFVSLGANGFLEAHRADVTDFVSSMVGSGGDSLPDFTVSNLAGFSIDGYSLVVVYSNPAEPLRTIAFLDGFSASGGDEFRVSFTDPLDIDASSELLMSLGIGFGYQGNPTSDPLSPVQQFSTIDVNAVRLTSKAGGFDDGIDDAGTGNGSLNTIGGIGDNTANPGDPNAGPDGSNTDDDELYNIAVGGFVETGDTSIFVETTNPSNDDNIYFAGFRIDGEAAISTAGNDAPVGVNDMASTDKDTPVFIPDVMFNDFDPDGDPIDLTEVNGAAVAVNDVIALPSGAVLTYLGNGDFSYDPNGIDADSDSFRYTISDGLLNGSARVDIDLTDTTRAYLSISDGSVVEGDSGTTDLNFFVTRTGDLTDEIEVLVDVTGLTASASDVGGGLPQFLSVTLSPGDTSAMLTVPVIGDTIPEFDETMLAEIVDFIPMNPDPAEISIFDGTGQLTIIDDDRPAPPPPPPVEADIWGDPHLTTLDGLGYDFQAVGEFILVESTSGDELTVQVRTVPLNDAVSIIDVMAMEVGGSRIQIDANADTPLTIDGVATVVDPLGTPPEVNGATIYVNDDGAYIIVMPSGEQVMVGLYDGFMNVCVFLNEDRDPGTVQGLLGNANNDQSDDLALRDGTVLPQPVTFDTLYSTYADSWRISEDEALFDRADGETTADFTDSSYPRVVLTLDDLPPELVADATAIVDAAGITDPILRENAILDYALTGNTDFATAANNLAGDPTADTDPTDVPLLGQTIGIRSQGAVTEGDDGSKAIQFEVYRIGDTTGALTATVSISGDLDDDDFETPFDPADLTVEFADGETSKTIVARIAGDTTIESDESVIASLAVDAAIRDTVTIIAETAFVTVLDDDTPDPFANETGDAEGDVEGDDDDNTLEGDENDNVLVGFGGNDTKTGNGGADDFRDTWADHKGDTITDFSMEDMITFFGSSAKTVYTSDTSGGVILGLSENPVASQGITLQGDFSGGGFLGGSDGTNGVVTYEAALPTLAEGTALSDSDMRGVVSDYFLTGNGSTQFNVVLDDANSVGNYDNALGVYEIDSSGNIVDVRILFENATDGTGSATVEGVEAGNKVGFFIIQDGADFVAGLSDSDEFSFVNGSDAANISDGDSVQLAVNGTAVDQTIFHSYSSDLNSDGRTHVTSGADDGKLAIGFEDLTGGGDNDFQDVLFTVELL